MTVLITDTNEWLRIIDRLKPTLYVSSDRQWFRNGFGMMFMYIARDNAA